MVEPERDFVVEVLVVGIRFASSQREQPGGESSQPFPVAGQTDLLWLGWKSSRFCFRGIRNMNR